MILDNPFPPDVRVENEAIRLIENGFEVYLFCLDWADQKAFEVIQGIHVHRFKFKKVFYKKLSPLAYSIPLYHYLLKNKIKLFIESNRIDVLHVHDMVIAGLVFQLNTFCRLPVVLDLHENRPEIMKTYTHINSGWGKLFIDTNRWERKQEEFIHLADKLIVVTDEAKKDILKQQTIREEDVIVVPNTVCLERFLSYPVEKDILEKYESDFVILYLGSTGMRRGIDTAIRSMKIVKERIQNSKLILVGNSRDDIRWKRLVSELNVGEIVVFEGWQDVTLFPSFIKASEVCISPLVRNRHHDTTYANKLFQYMSMGKPVVVSDCEAQKNVVRETGCGLVFKAGNEKELAEEIIQLYENPELRRQLGDNGRKAVYKKYNWKNTSKNLIHMYEGIEASVTRKK